jgi:hypothetical protein
VSKLGAKRRAALVAEVNDIRHNGLTSEAIVDLMLSRQAAQVAPLLEALRVHGDEQGCWTCRQRIAAYEATQADEPEPTRTIKEEAEAVINAAMREPKWYADGARSEGDYVASLLESKGLLARERAR